jgi:hypothetical protein
MVQPGQTWRFDAAGTWTDWFIECGPDGYENRLADLLDISPRVGGEPWFCLMGQVVPDGDPFRIGLGVTRTFDAAGEVQVFANDKPGMYWNNSGRVTLRIEPVARTAAALDTVAASVTDAEARAAQRPAERMLQPARARPRRAPESWLARFWADCQETEEKTRGIPFIAALVVLTGWVLAFTDQGKDLVVTVAEDATDPVTGLGWTIWLCATLTLFSLQAWFWSRAIVVYSYGAERGHWRPRWLLEQTPRLLAFIPFGFLAVALGFSGMKSSLVFIIPLLLIGVAIVALLVVREDVVHFIANHGPTRIRKTLATRPGAFRSAWILFSYAVATSAWLFATFLPVRSSQALGPAATVFLAVSSIVPVMATLIHLGRLARLPVVGALLVLAFAVSLMPWADNHGVGRRAPFATLGWPSTPSPQDSPAVAYRRWKLQAPPAGSVTPMIFVAAEGGASRAGYWTTETLSTLQDATAGRFSDSVFAITSVSGASVGAVGFIAALDDRPAGRAALRPGLEQYAAKDSLSPALAGMLFPDLVQRFTPLALLPDRGETIERSWEVSWADRCRSRATCDDQLFKKRFMSLWPTGTNAAWSPALLIEGASQETGKRIITSNLNLSDPASRQVDVDDYHDLTHTDPAVSTAILNGARYPWISPAGTFENIHGAGPQHVLDGGYFDATGDEVTRELAHAMLQSGAAAKPSVPPDNLAPVFLVIGNCAPQSPAATGWAAGIAQWVQGRTADLTAPLSGLYKGRDAHAAHIIRALRFDLTGAPPTGAEARCPQTIAVGRFEGRTAYFVPVKLCSIEGESVPLDWVLSRQAQSQMRQAAGNERGKHCLAADNIAWLEQFLKTGVASPIPQLRDGS